MIVARVVTGVWTHAGVRITEWIGAIPLILIGYFLYQEYDVFGISPSYAVMEQWAREAIWANLLLACGLVRLIALVVNGSFPEWFRYSPLIRFIASWLAMLMWAAVALSMHSAWRDYGGAPTGWVAYSTLALIELRNVYCARVDMVLTRGK